MNERKSTKLLLAIPLLVMQSAIGAACGGGNENLPPPPPPPAPMPAASPAPDAAAAAPPASSEAPPPAPPVQLSQGSASPDPPAPTPTVKIVAPGKGQEVATAKASDFEVKLDVKNWKTAQGDQHVHLILDAKPYKPIFDLKAPVKLSDLTGGEPLADGPHVLVAFPSRANHESVKTAGALAITEFWVGKKVKGDVPQDVTKPMVIYSRPKGEYKGDMASHVLVDFQLSNAKLEKDKTRVRITVKGPGIDGEKTAEATSFGSPFYLDNLQDGSYEVQVELLGSDGKVLPGSWNTTTRKITIAH